MTLQCPVCRAENTAGPNCRRCRADLSLLAAVETRRSHFLAAAVTSLGNDRVGDALRNLRHAESLRPGADIRQARACACLLCGDFSNALAEYLAANRSR